MLKLATGQQMVSLMQDRGVDVTPLTRQQILRGDRGADLGDLTPAERDAVVERRRCGSTCCARPSSTAAS